MITNHQPSNNNGLTHAAVGHKTSSSINDQDQKRGNEEISEFKINPNLAL